MGHQITAMFEWMKHTDNTLNARLNDDVYADDVPGEAEVRSSVGIRLMFAFYSNRN